MGLHQRYAQILQDFTPQINLTKDEQDKIRTRLNEAFPSLLDENGNRKSFEQFYNDVQKIDKTYNQNYLHAGSNDFRRL